jgi:hypothetical protein
MGYTHIRHDPPLLTRGFVGIYPWGLGYGLCCEYPGVTHADA